jgi:hypothetical protein
VKLADIKIGTCFSGQLGDMVFTGCIKDIYKKNFVIVEILQFSPNKFHERPALWPYDAFKNIGNINKISKNKYNCLKALTINDNE